MSNDPAETRPKQSRGAFVVVLVALLVILPVCYVLSIGPAVWLVSINYLDSNLYSLIYGPVLWLCKQWPALESFTNWWVDLFA